VLVCHCNGITDRKIRKAVRRGADNAGQVARMCGAGTSCGGCLPAIREIVHAETSARDEAPAPASSQITVSANL